MNQLRSLLSRLDFRERASIVAGALFVAAAIAGIAHYRTANDFRPLYTLMAPEDGAPVVQKLRESGVEFRLADNGATVLVRSQKLAESRLTLAGAGLPKSGRFGFELFDKTSFGATELVEHINYQRALEGELERSVMTMSEVIQARIHLTLSKESVFLDQQHPAKSSVMIKLRPGARISAQNVLAVTNLVASAVDGLSPDAVAVLDMDGNLLSRPRRTANDDSEVTAEALGVSRQIERDLVNKINSTLEPILGPNKFRASATVDCDLTSGDLQEETFDPDKSVMVSSQKSEDDSQRDGGSGGIPGTQANLPHPPPTSGSGGSGSSHRVESVTYLSSRIIRHTRIPQGVIRRISLSLLIGQNTSWEGAGKNKHRVYVAQSPETLQKIKDLVSGVTGFNADRGDRLIVETLPFESSSETDADSSMLPAPGRKASDPRWMEVLNRYRTEIIAVVVGIVLLAVAVRVFSVRRRGSRTPPVETSGKPEVAVASMRPLRTANVFDFAVDSTELTGRAKALLGESQDGHAERIRQLVQRDIGGTANVLRMWLGQKA